MGSRVTGAADAAGFPATRTVDGNAGCQGKLLPVHTRGPPLHPVRIGALGASGHRTKLEVLQTEFEATDALTPAPLSIFQSFIKRAGIEAARYWPPAARQRGRGGGRGRRRAPGLRGAPGRAGTPWLPLLSLLLLVFVCLCVVRGRASSFRPQENPCPSLRQGNSCAERRSEAVATARPVRPGPHGYDGCAAPGQF